MAAMARWQQVLSAVSGIVFILILLAIALIEREPTPFQIFIFRTVLALAAGAFATIVSGFIHVEARLPRFAIRAGAGLAVFIVVYAVNPPEIVRRAADSKGFVLPTTTQSQSGDQPVLVAPPDGSVVSLLLDKMIVDLQKPTDPLNGVATTTLSIRVAKYRANPAESVVNQIRGALMLSEDSSATVTVNVGGRPMRYHFPIGSRKPGMKLEGDLYDLSDFFRQITTPITWNTDGDETVSYPITLTVEASRKAKSDVAYVALDSLDAAVRYEGRDSSGGD